MVSSYRPGPIFLSRRKFRTLPNPIFSNISHSCIIQILFSSSVRDLTESIFRVYHLFISFDFIDYGQDSDRVSSRPMYFKFAWASVFRDSSDCARRRKSLNDSRSFYLAEIETLLHNFGALKLCLI